MIFRLGLKINTVHVLPLPANENLIEAFVVFFNNEDVEGVLKNYSRKLDIVKVFRSSVEQLNYRCEFPEKISSIGAVRLLEDGTKKKTFEEKKTENMNSEWIRVSTPEPSALAEFKSQLKVSKTS